MHERGAGLVDLATARARLIAKGLMFADTQTLRDLASAHDLKPYELVALIRGTSRP